MFPQREKMIDKDDHKTTMEVSANITTLLILVSCLTMSTSALENLPSMEFIHTSCKVTLYPDLCVSTLSSQVSFIRTSPKNMAEAALNVTLGRAHRTHAFMENMSRNQSLKPREAGALRDCVELVCSAVDEVKGSISELKTMSGSNFERVMGDIQTWVSAALTEEDTCSEGFSGKAMDGVTKRKVRARVMTLTQITSIALALVNRYASLHHG